MRIVITSPSLDMNKKVAGISAVTQFIITNNDKNQYTHFELGKNDSERRGLRWVLQLIKLYSKWLLVLFTKKHSHIHFNIALTKPSIIRDSPLIILARIFRSRMIIHLHGGDFLMHQKMPLWMKYLLLLSFSGKNPKIVLSPIEKTALNIQLGLKDLFVLLNCVDLKDARKFERNHVETNELKLLFLGRISDKKGIEFIYLALQTLKNNGTKFRFLMAGTGKEEKLYVTKFKELLGDDFEFRGVVTGTAKIQLLQECNVFLLPSFFEGLPMALLESMSYGLVPITTDVGSIKCVIEDGVNGIFVKPYSANDIVIAVERLSQNKCYMTRMSQSAQEHILANYNPEDYIARLNQIYNYE